MPEHDVPQRINDRGANAGHTALPVFDPPEGTSEAALAPVNREACDNSQAVHPFPIVGIGVSASSVPSYVDLFRHLSNETGMAFAVICPVAADQPNDLSAVLTSHTRLPIITIRNDMRPEPDHIYVVPPKARAILHSGVFQLDSPGAGGNAGRPIDAFLDSLATEQRNLAIGVVLSSTEAHGALGLRAIKGEGGIAIAQSPDPAPFEGVPHGSISADYADMVLSPAEIAQQLSVLAERLRGTELQQLGEESSPPDEERYMTRILKLLKSVSGVDFELYKPSILQRRIARRMLMHHIETRRDYISILQADVKELRELQEDILIGVTRFFRDPEVFEALKQTVFPAMCDGRSPDQPVRVWVPGCSSGEEVYSIAICLLEYFAGATPAPPIQIFGTDASAINIQRARRGTYLETVASEISAERLQRFFSRTEKGYQVSKRVRELCIFARQNLCADPPYARMDLISCRNVLIYFGNELQTQLVPKLHYALRRDGFLVLGNSEALRSFTSYFSLIDRKNKIYSRRGSDSGNNFLDISPGSYPNDLRIESGSTSLGERWNDLELQRAADRIILARHGPPGVIVDRQMQIVQFRGHTSPFLTLAPGGASLHLGRMLREDISQQVTAALRRAIEQDLPVQIGGLHVNDGEHSTDITLEVLPMQGRGSSSKCYLVLFVPSQANVATAPKQRLENRLEAASEGDTERFIRQLQHDFSFTRLYLQSLLEERDVRNQELISANEEIQAANEDLQSTNEELQSSNEELQTVNDELQNRNIVLTQDSTDLENLLNSLSTPVVLLSRDFKIRHFTPQTQRLMNLHPSDIGRGFDDIRLNLKIEKLEPLFAEVLDTLTPRELEVQDRDGHWYLLRIRPYRTADNKIDGLVVALVNIDQLQGLRNASEFARSIIDSIPFPLVVVDCDFRIRTTNEAFCNLADSKDRIVEGRVLTDLAAVRWGIQQPLRSLLETVKRDRGASKSFEFEHDMKDGGAKVILVRARPLKPDGEASLLVTFEDVTAHKEVERLLKAKSERLASKVATTTRELDRSREELRALAGSLLTTQEDERRRLARELHDDISQRLAALNIAGDQVVATIATNAGEARRKLEAALKQIGQLSEDVRMLSHRLHPSIIEDLGLKAALRSLTQEFGEREEMITTFFAQDVPEMVPLEVATAVYRIAQEALRNIAKHAGKTHVKVQLIGLTVALELQVTDSGKGFNLEQNASGLGLISMKERARLIGAILQVRSAPREGTRVTLQVPLAAAAL